MVDDQALVVHVRGRGLVVLTGCGHAGAVNIVRHAQRLTGVSRLHALLGGLHLGGPVFEPIIGPTVRELTAMAPDLVVAGHCTGYQPTLMLGRTRVGGSRPATGWQAKKNSPRPTWSANRCSGTPTRARSRQAPAPQRRVPGSRRGRKTLEHVAAGRGISFLARSATVFYTHPDVTYVPVPDLAPDEVCLAVATAHLSPVIDDFFTAAQAAAAITAECGNYEVWQLGGDAISKPVSSAKRNREATSRACTAFHADPASLVTTGASLVATYNGTMLLGQTLMPCLSAVLVGTLMYRSGLVPRALPLTGLIGAPLLLASSVAVFYLIRGWAPSADPRSRTAGTPHRRLALRGGWRAPSVDCAAARSRRSSSLWTTRLGDQGRRGNERRT